LEAPRFQSHRVPSAHDPRLSVSRRSAKVKGNLSNLYILVCND
jgi:hypothetical protein